MNEYHSGPNLFERFRGLLELVGRFEFDFRRCGIFFNDSNFWCVQSSITHNVAVHVPVLCPVCAHTIPFRMLWCLSRFTITKNIYVSDLAKKKKNTKPLWNVINMYMCANTYTFTHVHIHMYIHIHTHLYIYIYMYMYRYMCVCVCVSYSLLLRAVAVVSLRIAETEQLYQTQRMFGGICSVLLSTYSQTENGEDPQVSLVNL